MPVHVWTRVDAGLFHAFHQRWIGALCDALNMGSLPTGFFALPEQRINGPISDVLALALARHSKRVEADLYAGKANRITIRHRHGRVVAVIAIVSPGNKASLAELRTFVAKTADLIRQGIHLLVIDLFPLGKRDPQGIHKAIWDEFEEQDFELPVDKPLTVAAYATGPVKTAYVEPVAVGDPLPDLPLFLEPETYIPAPLEQTYQTTWNVFPAALKGLLEG